jgi:hypothetical protein
MDTGTTKPMSRYKKAAREEYEVIGEELMMNQHIRCLQ